MKSLTVDVFWPAWEWGPFNRPDYRYVCASYSEALTIRDNRRCRNIIRSEWYRRLWGDRFYIVEDQDTKTKYENSRTGFKIATSVGGLGTGERGDRFVIDDPHNVRDIESDAKREAVILWFEETVPTRVNEPLNSAIICIMQRAHERDVAGVILKKELGYEHLRLPMEYEAEAKCTTSIGFKDPRTKEDELLWPERMPEEVVERDKQAMTDYAVAAQFQQRPAPRGGGMFKRGWFEPDNIVDEVPEDGQECRGWDLAGTDTTTAAYTAGVKMKRALDGTYYITDVVRTRKDAADVPQLLKNTAAADGILCRQDLPQDPGSAGKFQVKYLVKQLAGYSVMHSQESGSKTQRAEPLASQARIGNVKLLRAEWNEDFLKELTKFPFSEFKDQTDAASRAFQNLTPTVEEEHVPGTPEAIAINA
jgi:predicted phage terminase large subunit-like protein